MAFIVALLECNWSDSATALAVVNRYSQLPSEAVAIARALEPEEREAAKGRMVGAHASPGKLPELGKGKTRDKVAKYTGRSGRTLEKATQGAAPPYSVVKWVLVRDAVGSLYTQG